MNYFKIKDCGYIKKVDQCCSAFKGVPDYEDHISDDEDETNPKNYKISAWKVIGRDEASVI